MTTGTGTIEIVSIPTSIYGGNMLEGDRHILISYLREGRWSSAGIMLSHMDHDTAFRIISGLSNDVLNQISFALDHAAREHTHRAERATYLRVAAVTLLRDRGAYGGLTESIAKEAQEDLEKIRTDLAGTGIMKEV